MALSISGGPFLLGRAAGLARPGSALERAAASVSAATVVGADKTWSVWATGPEAEAVAHRLRLTVP